MKNNLYLKFNTTPHKKELLYNAFKELYPVLSHEQLLQVCNLWLKLYRNFNSVATKYLIKQEILENIKTLKKNEVIKNKLKSLNSYIKINIQTINEINSILNFMLNENRVIFFEKDTPDLIKALPQILKKFDPYAYLKNKK
jgi:hypothetical protein